MRSKDEVEATQRRLIALRARLAGRDHPLLEKYHDIAGVAVLAVEWAASGRAGEDFLRSLEMMEQAADAGAPPRHSA